MTRPRTLVALAALLVSTSAHAEAILHAEYDAGSDALVLDIAYRGTHAEHPFTVRWAPCTDRPARATAGRLIDLHGRDAAKQDYRERVVLPLSKLPCRPVRATLRLGAASHATVFIPEAP